MLTLSSKTVSVSLLTALLAGCSGSKPAAQAPQPEAKPAANASGAALAGAEAQKTQDLGTANPGNPAGAGNSSSGNSGSASYPSLPGSQQNGHRVVRYSHTYESESHYRYRRVTSCSSDNYKTDCGFDLDHKTKRPAPKAEEPKVVRSLETLASLEYTANGSVGGSGGKQKPQAQKSLGSPTPLSSVPSGAGGALASTKEDSAANVNYLNVRSDSKGDSFGALSGLYASAKSSPENIELKDDGTNALAKLWYTQIKKLPGEAYIYQMSSTQDPAQSTPLYEIAIPVSTLIQGDNLKKRNDTPLFPMKAGRIANVSGEKVEADKANKVLIIESMTAGSANETLIKRGNWQQAIAEMSNSGNRAIVTSKSADGRVTIHCWIGFPRVEKLAGTAKRKKEFENLSKDPPAALAESSSICTISGLVD